MEEKDKIVYVAVDDIIPNRFQPRLAFDEKELNSLSDSIKKYGIIQPIVLRKTGEKYEIIAGERRYKASLLAGLNKIPAIINQTDDNTSAEIALLENLQRKNLTVIEESQSYKKLLDRGFTQDEIASKLGISQSSIANKLRLLNLPKEVQEALLYNKISERHARSLLSLNDSKLQIDLLNRIIKEKLTVKQTEEEISKILNENNNFSIDNPSEIKENNFESVKPVQEFLNIDIPEVISINQETTDEKKSKPEIKNIEVDSLSINPFQENFMDKIKEINEISSQDISEVMEDKIEKLEFENKIKNKNDLNLNDTQDINNSNLENKIVNKISLHKVIEKIRNCVNDLNVDNEKITVSEADLYDKYQINKEKTIEDYKNIISLDLYTHLDYLDAIESKLIVPNESDTFIRTLKK